MQKSMTAYIKGISKRNEGDDKEKALPVAHLGSNMISYGEKDFNIKSEFAHCLLRKPPNRPLNQGSPTNGCSPNAQCLGGRRSDWHASRRAS
jgi:hypothetical protein